MIRPILYTTLIAGTMDITAACLQAYFKSGVTPDRILTYIASGVFGKSAATGGLAIQILGLLFHFIIAFACVACYFWIYPKWSFLHKNIWLNSALIAVTAWFVTTQIILPLSQIPPHPFNLVNVLQAIAILYVCIGLPIAYFARQYFTK